MKALLIVLFAFAAKADTGKTRIAQETNKALDVSPPIPYAASPRVATQPATAEEVKTYASLAAAAKTVKKLTTKVLELNMTLGEANGRSTALSDELNKTQTDLRDLAMEKLGVKLDLVRAEESVKNARAELEDQRTENGKINKKLEAMTTWNRELIALHFIIVCLIPFGILVYFALRRQNTAILARLPNDETSTIIHDLNHELTVANLTVSDFKGSRDALAKTIEEKEKENNTLRLLHSRRVESLEAEITRLVALQQGSEATIARMAEESLGLVSEISTLRERLADEQTLASLGNGSRTADQPAEGEAPAEQEKLVGMLTKHVKAAMASDDASSPPPLDADPALAAAHSAAIDAIVNSRASLYEGSQSNASPQGDAVPIPADADGDATRKIEEPDSDKQPE